MTCTLLFPTWLLNSNDGYYLQEWLWAFWKNTANRADRVSISSIFLHSFTFLFSLSFTFFHPHFRSYTFHFSISLTFIHLYLFSFTFILIRSTSFTFIHTHFGSLTFYLSPYIGLPDLPSFTSISLQPLSSTFISLLFPSSAYTYHHLIVFIYLHLPPLVFIKIVRDYPTNYRAVSLFISD